MLSLFQHLPRYVRLPRSLRRQFQVALSILGALVLAAGGTAIYALRASTVAAHELAEERLVRLQQAQDLAQRALLIERESEGMQTATTLEAMRRHYGDLIDLQGDFDRQLKAFSEAIGDVSVLNLHSSGQALRNAAHVLAQLRESALKEEIAFGELIAELGRRFQGENEPRVASLEAILYRLQSTSNADEVNQLRARFLREAARFSALSAPLLRDLEAVRLGRDSGNQASDPFSWRLAQIEAWQAIRPLNAELARHVIAIVRTTQLQSDGFTEDYRGAMRALARRAAENQFTVIALVLASLLVAWAVTRFFLGQHVVARLQQVSRFLRRADDDGVASVPVYGHDEIGEMARAVEQFIAARRKLALVNAQLEEVRSGLERTVAERTDALRSANAQLQRELGERQRAESELARVNQALRMLSDANQILIHAVDERSLLTDVCRIVVAVGGYGSAWGGFVDAESSTGIRWVARAGPEAVGTDCLPADELSGSQLAVAREAIRSARLSEAHGDVSVVALPLVHSGTSFGVLCVTAVTGRAFEGRETAILSELAGDLAFGVETLRTRAEQTRAEQALQRSERHLRSIYENSPLAYQALDCEGLYADVNSAWCAMTGFSREQVLGRKSSDFLTEESADRLEAMLSRIREQSELHGVELEMNCANGSRLYVEMDAKAAFDEAGGLRHLHCLLHNIAERKATEKALLHHAAIIASTDDAIIGNTLDGEITSWNAGAERMFGYRRDEVIGRSISLLVPEHLMHEEALILNQVRHGNTVSHCETVRRRKDGSLIDVSVTVSPLRDAMGELIGASKIARDITEQKRVEQELRLAATAFESQEGIIITDANSVILRVNPCFSEITGYSAEDCVGRSPGFLNSDRQDAAFYSSMWQAIKCDGTWQGEVWNTRKSGEQYPGWLTITEVRNASDEVTHYVGTMTDITRRKADEEEIRELAFYDQLTRLPNRRLLVDRLQRTLASCGRSGRLGALLFIDLDDFKNLNDTFGHDMGDLLLRQVARRLTECVREGDTVARLGGDEFVVMLDDLAANLQEAAGLTRVVGEKILASLGRPYPLASGEQHSTPSIGATLFVDGAASVDELLKRADIAMYQAKAAGRNTMRFFNPEMQAAISARATLEADIREGLIAQQFLLYYQPQVDHESRITGAEALLRWQHPRRGLVLPAEFIPLAEETGLILPLGQWVLEAACRQLSIWSRRPETSHMSVAVNVSARQFHQPDFVQRVRAVLDATGVMAQQLELELTESLLLEDIEDTVLKMTTLGQLGVRFALDDFGTGYSSLAYLRRLPLHRLKIDKSFVRDVLNNANDAVIAQTIVTLADSLGLTVIAEGVETEAQRRLLVSQGCRAFQGYLFGHPEPAAEIGL